MFYRPFLLFPFIALTACGGTGSEQIIPLSSAGFAGSNTSSGSTPTFTEPEAMRLLRKDGDNPRLERQSISIEISEVAGQDLATITLDGTTYTLIEDPTDATVLRYADGNSRLSLSIFAAANDVLLTNLFAVFDGELNDAFLIFGQDTDPSYVSDRTGTANYAGGFEGTLRSDDYLDAFGDGTVELEVDFSQGTVSGEASLIQYDAETADFEFSPITITFKSTDIVRNGFNGEIEIDSDDFDGTLSEAGYDGRLFGEEASSIGAQTYGRYSPSIGSPDIVFEGGFVADEQ